MPKYRHLLEKFEVTKKANVAVNTPTPTFRLDSLTLDDPIIDNENEKDETTLHCQSKSSIVPSSSDVTPSPVPFMSQEPRFTTRLEKKTRPGPGTYFQRGPASAFD